MRTPLDRFHGTDAFLVFEGRVVTIDVTLNSDKDTWKADIVFNPKEMDWDELAGWVSRELASKQQQQEGGVYVWRA